MTRLWRQDLAWAGLILVISAGIGLYQGQRLIPLSKELWKIQSQLDESHAQRREMNTISLAHAYDLLQQGQALFIDARSSGDYAELHIPRALNLPVEELGDAVIKKVADIAKDREIVAYCGSANCDLSLMVAEKLKALGFTRVMILGDGIGTWYKSGYPVDHDRD